MSIKKSLLVFSALAVLAATPAFAQIPNDPGHPRVNEVDDRLNNQQERIDKGEANGTITPAQGARDERRDANIQSQEARDEAKHNGHLTKAEQRKLNKEENHNSKDIKKQHHKGKKREHKEHEEGK